MLVMFKSLQKAGFFAYIQTSESCCNSEILYHVRLIIYYRNSQ
jgi:hypothetical protein